MTIYGSNLTFVTVVNVGALSTQQIQVINDTTISFVAPMNVVGFVNVSVVTPGGISNTVVYEYIAPPII